jgi:hypothetical protein
MTITLDYTDLLFDDDRSVLLGNENDFHYELLFARIVFRVDAADFTLEGEEAAPLVDFSFALRTLADSLADGESESYRSPTAWARITLTRSGDQVAISASFTDATATAALSELRHATAEFHARVMEDLEIRYPKLADNPGAQKFFEPLG